MIETEIPTAEIPSTAEKLTGHVADYIKTYVELTTLKATEKATEVATISFTAVLVSFFGMIIMIFLGLGLAELLGESMTPKEAYFIVTGIYTVLGLIIIGFRKQIIFPSLRNKIISKMYENKHPNI